MVQPANPSLKSIFLFSVVLVFALLASGCGLLQRNPALPDPTQTPFVVFVTAEPVPVETMPVEQPTACPQVEACTAPEIPVNQAIDAEVIYDNYLLREGPGRLFEPIGMFDSGTPITVIGRAEGHDWVLVQMPNRKLGWMNRVGIRGIDPFDTLPVIPVADAVMVQGQMWNPDGTPAQYIGFSLQPRGNTDHDFSDHVTTGNDGTWTAFLPGDTTGDWEVSADSYGCPPEVAPGQCSLPGTFPAPLIITLPEATAEVLEFHILPY